jgi:hypothetical protein
MGENEDKSTSVTSYEISERVSSFTAKMFYRIGSKSLKISVVKALG